MIRPINSINSYTFKGIYRDPSKKYSPIQNEVIEDIKTKLRSRDDKNKSLEERGAKKGMDFLLDSAENECITLRILYGLKKNGVGVERGQAVYRYSEKVGTYDKEHPFEQEDLNASFKKNNLSKNVFNIAAALILALQAGIITFYVKNKPDNIKQQTEKFIQMKDSVVNQNSIVRDTLKIFKQN